MFGEETPVNPEIESFIEREMAIHEAQLTAARNEVMEHAIRICKELGVADELVAEILRDAAFYIEQSIKEG